MTLETHMIGYASRYAPHATARVALSVIGGLLLLVVPSCAKSGTGPNPKTTGTLIVTVEPVTNAMATVVVSGPNGYTADFSATDTLVGLAAGSYAVTRATATTSNGIVGLLFADTATRSPANVAIGDTALIAITFARIPGSGGLWVTSSDSGQRVAAQYTPTQLTTAAPAGVSLTVAGADAAFDVSGNLWIGDSSGNTITEYAAAKLTITGTPTAAVTITSTALQGPVGLVFDGPGDLWVSNYDGNTIVEFTARQLKTGGALKPAVVISGLALDGPARMAFDTSGNLWVPNAISSTVVALAPSSLVASGTPQPAVTLTAIDSSLSAPTGLAFDPAGNLWVANSAGKTIVAYTP
jgi:sugar lactone lactonase YvrE